MNKIKKYEFRRVSEKDVEDILTWKYEGKVFTHFLIMIYQRVR